MIGINFRYATRSNRFTRWQLSDKCFKNHVDDRTTHHGSSGNAGTNAQSYTNAVWDFETEICDKLKHNFWGCLGEMFHVEHWRKRNLCYNMSRIMKVRCRKWLIYLLSIRPIKSIWALLASSIYDSFAFDDCLSLLQKVCALWGKLNDVIDSLNEFNNEFNVWAKVSKIVWKIFTRSTRH